MQNQKRFPSSNGKAFKHPPDVLKVETNRQPGGTYSAAGPNSSDRLPPHSLEAEAGFLGCLLLDPGELLKEARNVRPAVFYDLRHRTIFETLLAMFKGGIVIDLISAQQQLKDKKLLANVGGLAYLSQLQDKIPSSANWSYYLEIMREKFALRQTIKICSDATSRIYEFEGEVEDLMLGIRADMELMTAAGLQKTVPLLDIISPRQARDFVCNPEDFMIGQGLVSRGQVIMIGGQPGVGKSRLATSLAVAGASGVNRWQNYPVRSQWRTLILQTENRGNRLKDEFESIPEAHDEMIRISRDLPHGMAFHSPEFRKELRAFYDTWPFQMLVLDPLNDIVSEDGQSDYKEAMVNIRMAFIGRPMPCLVIVAHLRKPTRETGHVRKSGRELLHEIAGTLAIGSTARTVFVVQAATPSMEDDRIIFEVSKANDCKPEWLKEYGTRSAWHRRNGLFEQCAEFDWNQWDNPGDEARRDITPEMLRDCFEGETELKPAGIAKRMKELFNVGESTTFRAVGDSENGYLRHLLQRTPTSKFKLKS